jgi:hypothetical protein
MNKEYSTVIKSGRAFNGAHRDAGTIVHLIAGGEVNGFWGGKSLCGTEPGRRGNGWHKVDKDATCYKCKTKLEKLTPQP